jgi:hypothetical protein
MLQPANRYSTGRTKKPAMVHYEPHYGFDVQQTAVGM